MAQLEESHLDPTGTKRGWTAARKEKTALVLVNIFVCLPAAILLYGSGALSTNRLEQPSDDVEAGQASGLIAIFLLGVIITVGFVVCQLKHTSPGAVVVRSSNRMRAVLVILLVGVTAATWAGTVVAYDAMAKDYPNPPILPAADFRALLLKTGIEASVLPPDMVLLGTPDESGAYRLEATAEGGSVAVGGVDRLPKGLLIFRVKKSEQEAKSVSRTWIGADGGFPSSGILYPSVCVERVGEPQDACMVRVGQTVVIVELYDARAGDNDARSMTVKLARAAVTYLEDVLERADPAR